MYLDVYRLLLLYEACVIRFRELSQDRLKLIEDDPIYEELRISDNLLSIVASQIVVSHS